MSLGKRRDIIQAATELFRHQGFHATGIDQIVSEAHVTKATLYNHFESKQQLIIDVIWQRSAWFRTAVEQVMSTGDIDDPFCLMNFFDVLNDFINDQDFTGCMFINVSGEYNDPDHPIHRAVTEHKLKLENYLAKVATDAGIKNGRELAISLALIFDGAVVHAQTTNTTEAANNAKQLAETIIRASI